jgi:hypothetical protein
MLDYDGNLDLNFMEELSQMKAKLPKPEPVQKPFQVEVLTWPIDLRHGFVGHTALRVPKFDTFPEQYVSHWPVDSCEKGKVVNSTNSNYEADFSSEGDREPSITKLTIESPLEFHQFLDSESPPPYYALDREDYPNCVDRVKGVLEDGGGFKFESTYSLGDGPVDRGVQAVKGKTTPNAFKHEVQSEVRSQMFTSFKNSFQRSIQSLFGGSSTDNLSQSNSKPESSEPPKPKI